MQREATDLRDRQLFHLGSKRKWVPYSAGSETARGAFVRAAVYKIKLKLGSASRYEGPYKMMDKTTTVVYGRLLTVIVSEPGDRNQQSSYKKKKSIREEG